MQHKRTAIEKRAPVRPMGYVAFADELRDPWAMDSEFAGASMISIGRPLALPRLPALGWATFAGPKRSPLPSVLDARDIRFTASGRAAIAMALRALGVGPDDRVLVPTYHCPTMISPIVAVGARPVFFAIDPTGAPRLDALSARDLQGVRAMIAAHYFGLPQPMAKLRAFCDEHRIALIEDCAHALYGVSDGRPVGQWGDYAIASLTKFLPVVDGGCLIASHDFAHVPSLAPLPLGAELKSFANAAEIGARYGRITGVNRLLSGLFDVTTKLRGQADQASAPNAPPPRIGDVGKWLADFGPAEAVHRTASWWTRWTVRHAHRARIVALRRQNYAHLSRLVADIPGVRALQPTLPESAAPYVFPLYVERPDVIYMDVRAAGIPVFRWDEVWPTCPALEGDIGIRWATHVFQLGCHQDLQPDDVVAMAGRLARIIHYAECSIMHSSVAASVPASMLR